MARTRQTARNGRGISKKTIMHHFRLQYGGKDLAVKRGATAGYPSPMSHVCQLRHWQPADAGLHEDEQDGGVVCMLNYISQ
jgi:hypothetical protein